MKVVAIVGLAGTGKTEVARVFEEKGFVRVRFGQVTDDEIQRRGLQLSTTAPTVARKPGPRRKRLSPKQAASS